MRPLLRRLARDTPLSWRLTGLYVAILATVLAVLGLVLYAQIERFLLNDTAKRLVDGARPAITRSFAPRRGNDPPQDLSRLMGELSSRDTVARLIATDGSIISAAQVNPEQPESPTPTPDDLQRAFEGQSVTMTLDDGGAHRLVVLVPLRAGDTTVGVLQLTTFLAAADSLLDQLRWALALGTLAAIALGTLLGVPVTRAALRPLARVTATSERIAAGDLSQRTDLPAGRDEIGRLATAFDRMVDQLEEILRAQRQFVADASHELRTPLTALGGLIEMLLLGVDRGDTATTQRALRTAHREVERLARLVGDLLTLSRLDAHPTLDRRPVDLAVLVAEVGEQTRLLAGDREVTWQADGPLPMEADADRLKQVFLNLTANAVAFTPEAGHIALRAARAGDRVRITVADDGAGIAPEDLPHLFERFYRGDKSRARRADGSAGSGLGLAIAHAIVAAHGGTIAVRSTLGQGTTFTVELPVRSPGKRIDLPPSPSPALLPPGREAAHPPAVEGRAANAPAQAPGNASVQRGG